MVDLQDPPLDIDAVAFVDDFSGTADTLVSWWENVEALVRPLASRLLFSALVMTSGAVARAAEFSTPVPIVELGTEADALGDDHASFDASERKALLAYCEKTGCGEPFRRGYGDCGLLLAFRHGCPNNSLPILWYGDKGWATLFLRRAI